MNLHLQKTIFPLDSLRIHAITFDYFRNIFGWLIPQVKLNMKTFTGTTTGIAGTTCTVETNCQILYLVATTVILLFLDISGFWYFKNRFVRFYENPKNEWISK